jgi:hypothetical protein
VEQGILIWFSVQANGTAPLTYQWLKDGVAINGATLSTFTINSVSAADAGSYTVVVKNNIGSATSNAATLAVATAPAIMTQPSSVSAVVGGSASFSVAASGTAPLVYPMVQGWRCDKRRYRFNVYDQFRFSGERGQLQRAR